MSDLDALEEIGRKLTERYIYVTVGEPVEGKSTYWQDSGSGSSYIPLDITGKKYWLSKWYSFNPYNGSSGYTLKEEGKKKELISENHEDDFIEKFDLLYARQALAQSTELTVFLDDEFTKDGIHYIPSDMVYSGDNLLANTYTTFDKFIRNLELMLGNRKLEETKVTLTFRRRSKDERIAAINKYDE